jgi:hypothetical protein
MLTIEGIHPSGQRVIMRKSKDGKFELNLCEEDGIFITDGMFKTIESAKRYTRSKYNLSGKWHWEIRIEI